MNTVKFKLEQVALINFIKGLLCCPESWHWHGITQQLVLDIKADTYQVQKEIYEWLKIRREG